MNPKKIRIALVDDHVLFRRGMMAMLGLNEELEVVFDCGNGAEALNILKEQPVDIVLMDLEMPGLDGTAATQQITSAYPDVSVIVLSMHDDEQFIVHLMKAGAKGYLLKNAEPEEIIAAIQSVFETGFYFNDRVSRVMLSGLMEDTRMKPKFSGQEELSKREIEVLRLICEEKTTTEIGEALFISPRTVEGHRNNILLKTGARNTAGMVVYAIRNRLVDFGSA